MQGYDYPINTIAPKENMLVVFPAWVPHAVEINLSDEERISLSFNFKLNRTLKGQIILLVIFLLVVFMPGFEIRNDKSVYVCSRALYYVQVLVYPLLLNRIISTLNF